LWQCMPLWNAATLKIRIPTWIFYQYRAGSERRSYAKRDTVPEFNPKGLASAGRHFRRSFCSEDRRMI